MNAINVIIPYRWEGMWVFDDKRVGLDKEPFVSGADDIIDKLVAGITDAGSGFRLIFSKSPFPGSAIELEWLRADSGGNWYQVPTLGMEGWLCPALFRYFESAPPKIHAQVRPRAA